jgi:hypothetical protein
MYHKFLETNFFLAQFVEEMLRNCRRTKEMVSYYTHHTSLPVFVSLPHQDEIMETFLRFQSLSTFCIHSAFLSWTFSLDNCRHHLCSGQFFVRLRSGRGRCFRFFNSKHLSHVSLFLKKSPHAFCFLLFFHIFLFVFVCFRGAGEKGEKENEENTERKE